MLFKYQVCEISGICFKSPRLWEKLLIIFVSLKKFTKSGVFDEFITWELYIAKNGDYKVDVWIELL